jgi:hypothetical protein
MTIKLVMMAAVYGVMLLASAVSAFARSGKTRRVSSPG